VGVPIQPGVRFTAGNPRVIVDKVRVVNPPGIVGRMYDLSRDGRRFLMIKAVEGAEQAAPPPQIVVVQNWLEELKRLVPRN
jgi:hypothetical protein